MQPLAVIDALDVTDDSHPGRVPRSKGLPVSKFVLQGREEVLRASVVVAVAVTAHPDTILPIRHEVASISYDGFRWIEVRAWRSLRDDAKWS